MKQQINYRDCSGYHAVLGGEKNDELVVFCKYHSGYCVAEYGGFCGTVVEEIIENGGGVQLKLFGHTIIDTYLTAVV